MLCAEPSLHARTAMVVAERLLPGVKFTVASRRQQGLQGGSSAAGASDQQLYMVECEGAGWAAGCM